MSHAPQFVGGDNISLKVDESQFDQVVYFFRDILKLTIDELSDDSAKVQFGSAFLWVDKADKSQAGQIWLELRTEDTTRAAEYLFRKGIARCDEVEELPPGYDGFWIRSPLGNVILVSGPGE